MIFPEIWRILDRKCFKFLKKEGILKNIRGVGLAEERDFV